MTNRYPGMNRLGRAALLAFGLTFAAMTQIVAPAFASEDATKIAWRTDLGQAQSEAKSRDKLLWIQFSGPWCGNCRRMEKAAFVHVPVLLEARERFVPVKLRSDEHENLALSLGLSVLPSTVIVRPNGEVVDKLEGYAEPDEFAGFLTTVLTREGRSVEQVAVRQRSKTARDSSIALAGYDPVSLLQDQKLVPGRTDLSVEHDGRVFRFANEAGRDAFLQKPDSFAPVNGGRCPVSQVDRGDFATGDPHWGVVYQGHLFLFKNLADRDRFAQDPERYAGVDPSVRATCPHCRDRSSLTRRITNRFSNMFVSQPAAAPTPKASSTTSESPASSRLSSFFSLDSVLRR